MTPTDKRPEFVRANKPHKRRLICSVDGSEGTGKSHFALTAPSPIAYISLDIGTDGPLQKFQVNKEIYLAEVKMDLPLEVSLKEMPAQEVSNIAQRAWKDIMRLYVDAMTDPSIKSIICDTGTEFWEVLRTARFGKILQVMPQHYGPVNAEWKDSLIRRAYDGDKHLLLLHKLTDEWVNNKTTGNLKRKGQSDIAYDVAVAGSMGKDVMQDLENRYSYAVTKCRFHPEYEGMSLVGPECDFPHLAAWILEGDVERWEEYA